jgi:hypothetical protein
LNQWVSIVAIVGGAVVLAWMRRHPIAEPVIPAPAGEAEQIDDVGPSDDLERSDDAESSDDAEWSDDAESSDDAEWSDDAEHSGGEPTA